MVKNSSDEIKIAQEATISMGGSLVSGLFQYLFNILIARVLGVELLGLYALAISVTRLGATVGKAGLDTGVFRFVARYRALSSQDKMLATIKRGVKAGLVGSLVVTATIFISADWIVDQIFHADDTILANLMKGFALAIPLMTQAMILAAVGQGFQMLKYKVLALQITPSFFLSLIFVALAFWTEPLISLTLAFTGAHFLSLLTALYFLRQLLPTVTIIGSEAPPNLVRYSLPLMMGGILSMLLYMSDIFMLGALVGSYETGLYQPALRTAGILTMIIASFGSIFAPMVSDLHAKNNLGKIQELLSVVCRWSFIIIWPLTLFLIVYRSQIMLVFGGDFLASTSSLSILAGSQVLIAITTGSGIIFGMTGHPRLNLTNNFAALVANVAANAYLIPRYGITGAAWGTFIAIALLSMLRLVESWTLFRLHPFSSSLIKPLVTGLVAAAVCLLTDLSRYNWHTVLVLFAGMIIFAGTYFLVYYILGPEQEDREVVKTIYRKLAKGFGSNGSRSS